MTFTLQGGCPDIGITEIPSSVGRINELVRFTEEMARRQRVWDILMDPTHRSVYRREYYEQLKRIRRWKEYHLLRILGRADVGENPAPDTP